MADPAPLGEDGKPKMSKSQMKRLAKQKRKAEEKAKKEAARKEKEAGMKTKPKKGKSAEDAEHDLTPQQYFENRCRHVESLEKAGVNPWPHKFQTTMRCPDFVEKYGEEGLIKPGDHLKGTLEALGGRILRKRCMGKLFFYDIMGDGVKVQIMADPRNASEYDFVKTNEFLRRGDIVGIRGFPGRSRKGELSLFPCKMMLLSPCLRTIPDMHFGIKDTDVRYRQRYLDLLFTRKSRETFLMRSKVISALRRFMDERHFVEVETPVLATAAGGATARPFETHHNELDIPMVMRIAPELFLKELVVGGLDRVYEVGKQFRNEGMDPTHNPEFTTMEFYMAYADYNDLMEMTEEMLCGIMQSVTGSLKIQYHPDGPDGPVKEVDFTRPWRRVSMIEGLEEKLGVSLPKELGTDDANKELDALCVKHDVMCKAPRTTARLLDKLVEHFLEPEFVNPTFLCDHAEIMSPLAKYHRSKTGQTERFELFVANFELCNAYTELNNPHVQRERFSEQTKAKKAGDDEAQGIDEGFCTALEFGLPPTGGWGMGIDRFVMLLGDTATIRDVLLFPLMKPVEE